MSGEDFDMRSELARLAANADQAVASAREMARITMAYHSELVNGGCPDHEAMVFTEAMIASMIGAGHADNEGGAA